MNSQSTNTSSNSNNNHNNNSSSSNRILHDQFFQIRLARQGQDMNLNSNQIANSQPANFNFYNYPAYNMQQPAINSNPLNPNLVNNRVIFMRRDDLERNGQRNQQPSRSTSYSYITNSNRGANHLIIESQVINMSPIGISSSNQQSNINSSNILDSDNDSTIIFQNQEEKDFIFGTENLAVSTENIDFVKCTICMHIYQNPIACGNCLNHFCTVCIREWLIRHPNTCPLCKNFREMRCVPMLKNMLDKLQFFCTNKKNGCEEIIRYEQVIKHEDSCEYKIEICPVLGCGQQMIKKILDKHIQEECEYVLSKCRWCEQQIKKKIIEEHEEACDQKEIICDLCGDIFQFKDQMDHNQKCPELILDCSWCSKKIKQKEIRDHEDCCGERIVRCQGCNYECCLNDHFLHNQTCQEIPVLCHRCQTKMKRRELAVHTIESCIENIQKTSSQKIYQLENENRELKRQLTSIQNENQQEIIKINNIITKNNQNQPFQFSQIYKDQDIFVNQPANIALVREYKKKRRDRFVIVDFHKPLLDTNQQITFKILSRRSDWFAIGICDESNVYSSRRYHDIGHLSYLISANGILYSSHSANENWQNRSFQIEIDNVISIQFLFKPGPSALQNSSNAQSQNNMQNINSSSNQVVPGNSEQNPINNNNFASSVQNSQLNNQNNNVNSNNAANINMNSNNEEMRLNEMNSQNSQNINNNQGNINNQSHLIGSEMKLKFINHTENQELIINLDSKQISDGKFYYCACLRCPGDSVQILPNYQQLN
ncbi:TRAF-type zinc finger protein (macronuclear) [Tetrahymena thermophila SB210]|uniref:TRAF-type zinc finger protein n=1 Tax=Tetrahymena thermophila (strain SB210) TaxID=312017 RepID=I7MIR4_TETTS|nr:TRAF-type zinc finger protein [Tetrahymena thermophila SB210]EAS04680.1 TRAF-type zinc finger protein [Tetrahymena thermophila SB210]|eukprot:XP_001024925.1 TRAF-type zinc finger protein [Tetrahymena thermophila SB210]